MARPIGIDTMDKMTLIAICLIALAAVDIYSIHKLGIWGLFVVSASVPLAQKLLQAAGITL